MRNTIVIIAALMLCVLFALGQETFRTNGVQDVKPDVFAFTGATIVVSPTSTLSNATLLIRDGKVEAVGTSLTVPPEAIAIDVTGTTMYPSFIDLDAAYGLPEIKKNDADDNKPHMESERKEAYGWNDAINSDRRAHLDFVPAPKQAAKFREAGFGAVLTFQHDGIARGSSALVATANDNPQTSVIKDMAAAHYSFDKGASTMDYPGSLMGAIALLRQTYLDASWYAQPGVDVEYNISLEAWNELQRLPQIFQVEDKLSALRADRVGDEFKVQYIIRGNGDEYQRLDEMRNTNAVFIVPLNFPASYDVSDPFDTRNISLRRLKHWELAPSNCAQLAKAGITFAITSAELEDKDKFLSNLRQAVRAGLGTSQALEALTTTPARILGVEDQLGTLAKGKKANFFIASSDIFEDDAFIYEHWVQGKRHQIVDLALSKAPGTYNLTIDGVGAGSFEVTGTPQKLNISFTGKKDAKADLNISDGLVQFAGQVKGADRSFSGWINQDSWNGKGQDSRGAWFTWSASKSGPASSKSKNSAKAQAKVGQVWLPNVAYGWNEAPTARKTLIRNATVWTNEKDGILQNADVLIDNGKIVQIGSNLPQSGAVVVDGTDKHLTPGIVDEHSHIAISRGVNEWTEAVSAEVRIGDVINSDDIAIYQHLAGGVTTSQLLHGSANPVGGQSAIIKLRWGRSPEEMKLEGADGFIKCALGENVKQSNWGENFNVRFPQSRMGVEQTFVDAFTRAREYERAWKAYETRRKGPVPRKDLELDALVEILNSKRFITCHSYVQSEITMLMRVAERFGFNVNTFTHILEGYKVADKMQRHGAGGSTFADWWAYKYEVIDAIPYNAALMHEQGVVVAINSDSREMGRRLNQEAAKAMKYGGVSEEDALKFVTLNPAILLHIDDRVGSIKVGKDADLVLWNDHPLSIYATPVQTYVDGIAYFDAQRDLRLREKIADERVRIIAAMRKGKNNGDSGREPVKEEEHDYHCDDIGDYGRVLQK